MSNDFPISGLIIVTKLDQSQLEGILGLEIKWMLSVGCLGRCWTWSWRAAWWSPVARTARSGCGGWTVQPVSGSSRPSYTSSLSQSLRLSSSSRTGATLSTCWVCRTVPPPSCPAFCRPTPPSCPPSYWGTSRPTPAGETFSMWRLRPQEMVQQFSIDGPSISIIFASCQMLTMITRTRLRGQHDAGKAVQPGQRHIPGQNNYFKWNEKTYSSSLVKYWVRTQSCNNQQKWFIEFSSSLWNITTFLRIEFQVEKLSFSANLVKVLMGIFWYIFVFRQRSCVQRCKPSWDSINLWLSNILQMQVFWHIKALQKEEEIDVFLFILHIRVSFPLSSLIYFQDFWQTSERDFFQELFKARLKNKWRRNPSIFSIFYIGLKTMWEQWNSESITLIPQFILLRRPSVETRSMS